MSVDLGTPWRFRAPALLQGGAGSVALVPELVTRLGGRRVLLMTDTIVRAALHVAPAVDDLARRLAHLRVWEAAPGEPTTTDVAACLAACREGQCDLILAVGGGAVIDTAKAVAVMATNGGQITDYAVGTPGGARPLVQPGLPLVAVPTTAGTGSEVTPFTVITAASTHVKWLIAGERLIPSAAVVDPLLTLDCPPRVTAAAGLDTLTHAIEAYVSRRATPLSDTLALSAVRRVGGNLVHAYTAGDDLAARTAMAWAAVEAGLAFANSSVALVHGMARPLGAYFAVPHGLANAMLLSAVTAYSLPAAFERYADLGRALTQAAVGGGSAPAHWNLVAALGDLCGTLDVPRLRDVGVVEDELARLAPRMAADALASGSPANNPRVPTAAEIVRVYQDIY